MSPSFLDAPDVLDLVARRAEAMDAVSPRGDGMLFVRGLSREIIGKLCGTFGAAIAIVNPGGAFVIGGSRAALKVLWPRPPGRMARKMLSRSKLQLRPIRAGLRQPRLSFETCCEALQHM